MKELAGGVAVVTGGASGIGLGLATRLAEEGMDVVIADIEQSAIDAARGTLDARGLTVDGVRTDVSDEASVLALRDAVVARFGRVDVVCNNAGVGVSTPPVYAATAEHWNWVLGVNFFGVLHGIRAFVPTMIEQGTPGHVVNTASMAGVVAGHGLYGVSKNAVVALSEALAGDLAAVGAPIGVTVLCPGGVPSNIGTSHRNAPDSIKPGLQDLASAFSSNIDLSTMPAFRTPEEVAQSVVDAIHDDRLYLLSHPGWDDGVRARYAAILGDA